MKEQKQFDSLDPDERRHMTDTWLDSVHKQSETTQMSDETAYLETPV